MNRSGDNLGHFKIDGVYCRLIPLTRDQFAIVWESDYPALAKHEWMAHWDEDGRTFYACRAERLACGKVIRLQMHRVVTGLDYRDTREVDHIDAGNGLDNRRSNLRIVSHQQNAMNRRARRSTKASLKGVSWRVDRQHYRATIRVNGKLRYLGSSDDPFIAHELYCKAAKELFGEYARFK